VRLILLAFCTFAMLDDLTAEIFAAATIWKRTVRQNNTLALPWLWLLSNNTRDKAAKRKPLLSKAHALNNALIAAIAQ